MNEVIIKIVVLISSLISLSALVLGVVKLFKKDIPGFFVLTICSVACCHLQDIHTLIGYLCGDYSDGVTISTLAIFGCFSFFLSASLGPIDKLQDKRNIKIILISLIAPIIMFTLLVVCSVYMFPLIDTTSFILVVVFYLPSVLVSYYVLKHTISNDETGIYKAIRGCNIIILINVFINMLYLVFSIFETPVMLLVCYLLRSISMLALTIESIRGYKKWKTLL